MNCLKTLSHDLKLVFEIGRQIMEAMRNIKFSVAKEDYSRAIHLKKRYNLYI